MRRTFLIPILVLALAPAGCIGRSATGPDSPGIVHGSVRGLDSASSARVVLYRLEGADVAVREPGAAAAVDATGHFRTGMLAPGRYLLALEAPGRPVSVVRATVPQSPAVVIRARKPLGAGALEIRRGPAAAAATAVALSRAELDVPIAERRTARFEGDASVRFDGLGPGRWRLDLVGTGWTTEVEVAGEGTAVVVLDPPPLPPLGSAEMRGRVLRASGRPVRDVAVTVRPLLGASPLTDGQTPDGQTPGDQTPDGQAPDGAASAGSVAGSWGRYALTDSDGGYHMVGVPAGRSLIRLESRDTVHARLPPPEAVVIPPSGSVMQSFVIGR